MTNGDTKKVMEYISKHYPCGCGITGWHTTDTSLVVSFEKEWSKDGTRKITPRTIVPLSKVLGA